MTPSTRTARAADALRRGEAVTVTAGGTAIAVAAVETGADLGGDLLLTPERAAVLKLANQRAAAGAGAVRIARAPWLDAATAHALADPTRDLAHPLKGPFATLAPGPADAAALRLAKRARLLPALTTGAPQPGSLSVDAVDIAAAALADSAGLTLAVRARLPLDGAEHTTVAAFRPADGGPEHLALIIGDPPRSAPPLVRLHSACLTGDVLGSLKCDCGPQLRGALARIATAGGGVLLYLQQEGRGIGLLNKLRAYALQDQGFDTVDANLRLGFEADERDFAIAAAMLTLLGFGSIRLLTNNPAKAAALTTAGIEVAAVVPHQLGENPHNAAYLATKRDRSGHLL